MNSDAVMLHDGDEGFGKFGVVIIGKVVNEVDHRFLPRSRCRICHFLGQG